MRCTEGQCSDGLKSVEPQSFEQRTEKSWEPRGERQREVGEQEWESEDLAGAA